MRVLCVIPARIGSSRLPEKPLQLLGDQPLIRIVAQRAAGFRCVDRVVVATDDRRVLDVVSDLAVDGVLTAADRVCGTERVGEVARIPRYGGAEVIVNLQGDEPFVAESVVAGVVAEIEGGHRLATAAADASAEELVDPHAVKVLVRDGVADRFARGPASTPPPGARWYRHIGVYAYRPGALARWVSAPAAPEEVEVGLEQLRPMGYGEAIGVWTTDGPAPPGIDTRDDLEAAQRYLDGYQTQVRV